MLFLGTVFLSFLNIHYAIKLTQIQEQNKSLAQRIALLEVELKNK